MCDTHLHASPARTCAGACSGSCRKRPPSPPPPASPPLAAPLPAAEHGSRSSAENDPAPPPAAAKRILPSLDSVTTFGATGKRQMPRPTHVDGRFSRARRAVGLGLLLLFLFLPWIPIGGAPALFLNLREQRFHLLGLTFLPQDLWLIFFLISGLGFTLFALTALLGRVWCGWACPLTVFLDLVRRVERWLEGEGPAQKRLESEPWTLAEGVRRLLKHGAMAGLALLLAHGLLAYFVSLPGLFQMMHEPPQAHWRAFLGVSTLGGVLWFNFAWFREQFCIVLCPYGRLQSVLTDEHSLVVGYDARRGEPRGKMADRRTAAKGGDCVDCLKCVRVCPTGIDIRQGLQLECIGCAACIDACDSVMTKLHRPKGLIRYDSMAGLKGEAKRVWRPRMALYLALGLLGVTALSFGISTLRFANVSVTRMSGPPYFVDGTQLRNQFLLRLVNKRARVARFEIGWEGSVPRGLRLQGDLKEEIARWGEKQTPLVLTVPISEWKPGTRLRLVIRDEWGVTIAHKTVDILGPEKSSGELWGKDGR